MFATKKKKDLVFDPEKTGKKKFYKKGWFIVLSIFILAVLIGGSIFAFKAGYVLNRISESDNSSLKSLLGVIPGVGGDIKESDGRINILLVGMRGENIPGGGLLADTILVLSMKPSENKVAMISIPRDLYVTIPGTSQKSKINAVYAHGAEKNEAFKEMQESVEQVTGLPIHYSAALNFVGFKQLIDGIDGIDVFLETDFYETSQFVQGQECGGEFTLSAGNNHLDGETALCYARARENTSDFDRTKRQQVMLKALKDKLTSLGTLTDFSKLNSIMDAAGDNLKTNMSSSEMKKFYTEYASMKDAQIYQRVFENSEEGMLKVPEDAPKGAGYILIPRAGWDDYSKIHEVCKDIFNLPAQSDIQPVKQYSRPQSKTEDDDKDKKTKKKDKDDKKDKD